MPPYVLCDNNNDGFGIFDLSSQISAILNGLNPTTTTVSFHELLTYAQVGANPITPINSYTNLSQNQTVYIRVFDTSAGQVYYSTINLVANSNYAGNDGSMTICDTSTATINLFDLITSEQLGGTWARISGTGGTLNTTSGVYTSSAGSTTSVFSYTLDANLLLSCPSDSSIATVIVQNCILQPTCGGTFTDPAGATANYVNNSDYTVTICPSNPGDMVTVTFTAFGTEATWDALYVFNGNSISSTQIASTNIAGNVPGGLAGGYWGTAIPGPFTSTSPNGCLTFRFRSDASVNSTGWIANVTCRPPPACSRPTAILSSAFTLDSAVLAWTQPSNPDTSIPTAWECLAVPEGSPAPTASSTGFINVTTNPFVLVGLTATTCYNFYVRAVCSATDRSEWSVASHGCTLTPPLVCGGQFIDNGGATANYANNSDNTYTVCPTNLGDVVSVIFNSFDTETTWDALYVFDGNSITAPQIASSNAAGNVPGGLAGGFWGTTIPGPFTSSSPDGCLTFRFRSDNSVNRAGWVANVTCAPDTDKILLVAFVDQNANGIRDIGEPLFPNGSFVYQQNSALAVAICEDVSG